MAACSQDLDTQYKVGSAQLHRLPVGDARLGATDWVVVCSLVMPGGDVVRHHACSDRAE